MNLQSLVFSSDDKTTRVLRRLLGGLEISLEHCTDIDSAIGQITRRRFEAVILDCEDDRAAARMLGSIRSAPCNKRAIVIAIIDRGKHLQLDADFILYKPLSFEQAQHSFRAVRYLMKCECRRNTRVAVQFPVSFLSPNGKVEQGAVTSDISESGMAVRLPRSCKKGSPVLLRFTLPGTDTVVECRAELAWENAQSEAGFRFIGLSPEQREQLRVWLSPYYFDYQIPANSLMPSVLPGFLPATE